MEKNISKKLFLGALALSAGCILASCAPVSAVPSNYNEPFVEMNSKAEFDDNKLGTLYDAIAGDTNAKVVERITKELLEEQFGTYEDYKNDTFTSKAFFEGKTSEQIEAFKKDVDLRLSEYFYNEVVSGSYVDEEDGQFSEKKLYEARLDELYDLDAEHKPELKFYVTKSLTKGEFVTRNAEGKLTFKLQGDYTNFIEKKVFPEILKNILVEDYIYRTSPMDLGRSYAREISYVKIPYESESHTKIRSLCKYYAKYYIEAGAELNYEDLIDAIKGFSSFDKEGVDVIAESGSVSDILLASTYGNDFVTVDEAYVYEALNQTLVPAGKYYKETKLGKIIESFQKAIKAEKAGRFPLAEDKAELDKFTSEGKTKEYGLLQKLIALAKEDYTTDGWFVKNGGASELPLKDRLFSYTVSNEIEKSVPETKPGDYVRKSYLRNIKGVKFVLSADADKFEDNPYNYLYDDNGSALWLCNVTEAVSPQKFNERLSVYYGAEKVETIGRQVAKVISTKDNYKRDAYTEYLNKVLNDVTFFDSSLYEYLKSEYPDLEIFED